MFPLHSMRVGFLAAMLFAHDAVAQELPSFARNKPANYERKDEGSHVEGLPLVGYDTNIGLGLGAGGYFTMNGKKSDSLFRVTPYRHRFFVQAYFTTLGFQQHILSYDGLYLGDSPYRLRASFVFERNINANYFGTGERTLDALEAFGRTHATYDEQTAAVTAQGSPLYNHYEYVRPTLNLMLERDLFGGIVRIGYGASVQYVNIGRYDGTIVDGRTHGVTKLGEDCAVRSIRGCEGGWNDTLRASIALDTRDFEPDPRSGVFIDAVGEWSSKGFGSAFDYARFTGTARFYWSVLPREITELVLASRVLYSMQTSGAPFYAMPTLAMSDANQEGLGGENTMRGYRQNRFIGAASAVANVELRWTFWRLDAWRQHLSLQAAPFVDVGRVFDRVGLAFDRWRMSAGGAVRIGWNRTTIARIDVGASREDVGFYVDFGMPY